MSQIGMFLPQLGGSCLKLILGLTIQCDQVAQMNQHNYDHHNGIGPSTPVVRPLGRVEDAGQHFDRHHYGVQRNCEQILAEQAKKSNERDYQTQNRNGQNGGHK